jgi:pimeloyl-ACP methyl ester carboxylesterase
VERVAVGAIRLAVHAQGPQHGRPVLLLHGQPRFAWGETQGELARRGYRAVGADLRGHGQSDWAADGDYSPATIAQDVLRLVEWTGSRPALVGAFLGGIAALLAAGGSDSPICSALVLVDVTPCVNLEGARRVISFMRSHLDGFGEVVEAAEAVASYLPHRPRPAAAGGLAKNLRQAPNGRLRWHSDPALVDRDAERRMMAPERLLAAAARVTVPTLLVRGALSDRVTTDTAAEFQAVFPGAEFVTVLP